VLLVVLTKWNPSLCRRAGFDTDHSEPFVQRSLLDAAVLTLVYHGRRDGEIRCLRDGQAA
jgi:hypothetical protein